MESEPKIVKNKVLEYLEAKKETKPTIEDLHYALNIPIKELRKTIRNLLMEDIIYAIPVKRHSKWYWNYYIKPRGQRPINQRLEEIFEELAIPPYLDIALNRGFQIIFIGKYGSRPGFSIIDFSYDPPLIFKDKMYGGENDEIIFLKQRSKYICKKGDKEIWYNLHGNKIRVKQ